MLRKVVLEVDTKCILPFSMNPSGRTKEKPEASILSSGAMVCVVWGEAGAGTTGPRDAGAFTQAWTQKIKKKRLKHRISECFTDTGELRTPACAYVEYFSISLEKRSPAYRRRYERLVAPVQCWRRHKAQC